jgi:hypothetical protein
VTNSYNGLRALAFDIGFFRRACTNGIIVYDSIIRFKFTHLRRDIGEAIRFDIAHDKLARLRTGFGDYLTALRGCSVGEEQLAPFVCGVLSLCAPKRLEPDTREAKDWATLNAHVAELCNRYARELGNNAYAVFNAVTEFASHPLANRHVHRDRNTLQRMAGAWLSKFAQQCREPKFDLTSYLAELAAPNAETLAA